ncbi:MAG: T9SS type A sorting domain-containing protein [Chitinophagaceae bacterium]|nr:T9SS type A sorting domain-containing protein [Chitinophagaceae bacterium]
MKKYYLVVTLLFSLSCPFTTIAQNLLWAKSAGSAFNDIGHAIKVDASGNVYTTGTFQGTVDFDAGAGTYNLTSSGDDDIYILKSDPTGNFIWAKKFGGGGLDHVFSMILDQSGNVYTMGTFLGTVDFDPGTSTYNLSSAGMDDAFISKLDTAGNFIWAKSWGSTDQDEAFAAALDYSGNVYVTGDYFGTVDFDPGTANYNLTAAGGYDIFILKLDANGNFSWVKSMGGPIWDFALSVAIDGSGNVYTIGYFDGTADFDPGTSTYNLTSAGNYDVVISKLDASGNFIWADRMGGSDVDYGFEVTTDVAGNVFIAGEFKGTADFDPGTGVNNLTSQGTYDMFICKLDNAGNLGWVKSISGTLVEYVNSMSLDADGNIYSTGYFQGTTDFDPGTGTTNVTATGDDDIFICKLDASGNLIWVKNIGGDGNDIGVGMTLDADKNIYVTGYFTETVDFDPEATTYELTSSGGLDAFQMKVGNANQTGIHETSGSIGEVTIYPNPGQGFFHVACQHVIDELKITNGFGQTVHQFHPNNNTCDFFVLEKGMYFIQISSGGSRVTKKIVVGY